MGRAATRNDVELITDDPRKEIASVLGEWRAFRETCKEEGGLITQGQAAVILGVSSGTMSVWMGRGRFSTFKFLGAKFVSSREVLACYDQREKGEMAVGGRGHKAPALADLVRAAKVDFKKVDKF